MRVNLEPGERIALVQRVFNQVAGWYDFLNHFLSLGQDLLWRRATARAATVFQTGRILDLATGTGDLAIVLARRFPWAEVVGLDFNWPMLTLARRKLARKGIVVRLVKGDALALPFPDRSFDTLTIAFGIRNIPDRTQALREMLRVLTPGGKALILELTCPEPGFIRSVYRLYLTRMVPRLGGFFSKFGLAYTYLADSILDFPIPRDFCASMRQAGFAATGYFSLTFGIATLHWGVKEEKELHESSEL